MGRRASGVGQSAAPRRFCLEFEILTCSREVFGRSPMQRVLCTLALVIACFPTWAELFVMRKRQSFNCDVG